MGFPQILPDNQKLQSTRKIIPWERESVTESSSIPMINKQPTSCNQTAKISHRFRNKPGSKCLSWSHFVMSFRNFELSKKSESKLCRQSPTFPEFHSERDQQVISSPWRTSTRNNSYDKSYVYKGTSRTGRITWQNILPEYDKRISLTNQENPKLHWLSCHGETWHQRAAAALGGGTYMKKISVM